MTEHVFMSIKYRISPFPLLVFYKVTSRKIAILSSLLSFFISNLTYPLIKFATKYS